MRRRTTRSLLALLVLVALPGAGGAVDSPGQDVVVNSLGMRLVLVPAGTFRMGSLPGEPSRQDEEAPRRVILTRAFRICATEITQGQWSALMPTNRSQTKGDDLPVTSVSWNDARDFCARLSEKEGVTYRLPTEAEWEYACRAGTTEPAAAGARDAAAWYADNSEGQVHPVGTKTPNPWGLFDMLGNAAEWTLDAYGPYPAVEEERDPRGPPEGNARVVRGGAFRSFPPAVRCAARTGRPRSYQLHHVGLRVVQEIP